MNLIYLLMLDARMLSEQAWRQEEEPVKVAIQNYKNLDLWVLWPWKGWHAPWCRRIIHIHAPLAQFKKYYDYVLLCM